ncbi:MAG: Nramp family divalent metal transporter [Rhodothermales bacterium]
MIVFDDLATTLFFQSIPDILSLSTKKLSILAIIGPGILISATGVGAGDLAAGAFAGSKLGVAVLWAVLLGAFIKYVITEGLTRWQLATGLTLIEGAILKLGRPAQYFFISYFLIWTFGVGSSLVSACGVAAHALFPVFDDPEQGKLVFGILHSLMGLGLVWIGSFKLFERVMSLCVGVMFVLVVVTAILVQPDWLDVARGMVIPSVPEYIQNGTDQGIGWTLALMGGVGGTLTILSYGYWIREEGREGPEALSICRLDLAVAYIVTAVFGLAIIIIASKSDLDRQASATLVVSLSNQLGGVLGSVGRGIFLIGAWAAMFTSLLGVWQSVPYMFADYWRLTQQKRNHEGVDKGAVDKDVADAKISMQSRPYRVYLIIIATIPMAGLLYDFELVQKLNSIYGALVMPMVALVLILLNGRQAWVGAKMKNHPVTAVFLVGVLVFFFYLGGPAIYRSVLAIF